MLPRGKLLLVEYRAKQEKWNRRFGFQLKKKTWTRVARGAKNGGNQTKGDEVSLSKRSFMEVDMVMYQTKEDWLLTTVRELIQW